MPMCFSDMFTEENNTIVVFLQQGILIRITAVFRTIETKLNNVISMLILGSLRGGKGEIWLKKGFWTALVRILHYIQLTD